MKPAPDMSSEHPDFQTTVDNMKAAGLDRLQPTPREPMPKGHQGAEPYPAEAIRDANGKRPKLYGMG